MVPAGDPTSVGVPQYPGQAHAGQPTDTSWRPPPPPPAPVRAEHTGRWIAALSAVVVVVAGLLGAGIWLVTRSLGPSVPAGYRAVDTPYLSYAVPEDWAPVEGEASRILGVTFTGGADGPPYTCRGDGYRRGLVTSTLVRSDSDPASVATRFATQLGRTFYTDTAGQAPQVELSPPRTTAAGTVVEATVTTAVDDGCLATRGVVAVLAAPVEEAGGTAVLVANVDTVGGPADSPLPDPAIVTEVVDSAG
ncbi:hypothetical protein GCM10023175_43520 [Pseudonocardia xishanensis]|uniref:DUF8017 domain-containing protein n=1 Tax=Pseudonocardia xishanensis TaxID=630995 RepID=A0ABP8RWQ4_9PSEU